MKLLIWVFLTVGGIVGGWLGSMIDGGGSFGFWGIAGAIIGSLIGIWAGYKIAQNYL